MKMKILYSLLVVNLISTAFLAHQYFNMNKFSDKILKVRGLVVVDSTGVERVVLGAPLPNPIILGKRYPRGGNTSGILLYDANGTERSGYVTDDNYPNVFFTLDAIGPQRALFLAEPQGATSLWLWSDNNNRFAVTTSIDTTSFEILSNGKKLKLGGN